MIQNDDQLSVVREQLSLAESALESLRRDMLPKNEKMYYLMSESYVDTIKELRGEVDTYLGINAMPANADLVISLEGERVGLGKTSAGAVTKFIDTFRRGVQSAVEIVESGANIRQGRRRPRWIENICDLPIVGLAPGSVPVMLAEPEDQSLFSDENRKSLQDALDLIFYGLAWADVDDEKFDRRFSEFSPEVKQAILALVTQLLPPRTGEISQVSFRRRSNQADGHKVRAATLTRNSRQRIRDQIEAMVPDSVFREITGVIRKLDLDDRSFTLRDRTDGDDLRCEYGSELEDAVKENLDTRVVVTGTLEVNRKQKEKLLADSIEAEGESDQE